MYTRHISGTVSELLAQEFFINHDCIVSKPINHFSDYDLLIDKNDKIYKVQVKSIYREGRENKGYRCNIKVGRRVKDGYKIKTYSQDTVDYICAVEPSLRVVYLIPFSKVKDKTAIYLHPIDRKSKLIKGSVDYEIYKDEGGFADFNSD